MEQRYFIELSFKGTAYHGWQVQPNALSVQQTVEDALMLLIKYKVRLTGAGRTDTGVHASYFVAHFTLSSALSEPLNEITRKLNYILPNDIAILNIFPVKSDDNSRFSALSRTYKYHISKRKNPFKQETSYYISTQLNIDEMNKAAGQLFNYNDFSSFCRSNSGTSTYICTIKHAGWEENDEMLVFTIKANRFLRNMVRAITGTLLNIGYGKITAESFREIIEAKDRRKAGKSAPAHGLFLTDIEYPAEILSQKNILNNQI